MEATETINQNGDIERTVVLNPEESNTVLEQMSPGILDQINQTVTAITSEDLERILDEAAGITPITQEQTNTESTIDNMFPSDNLSSNFEYINESENTNEEQNEEDLNEVSETTENTTEEVEETPIVYNTNLNLGPSITTSRFNGAEWFDYIHTRDVIIGGAGGISSWLALLLSRTDVGKITIYDDDIVEAVNLSGQFFSINDIKNYKVCAVTDNLRNFSNYYRINYQINRYKVHSSTASIMMCGFDNMEARKTYFQAWKGHLLSVPDKSQCLFLDGRLSAECLQVYCIQGDDEASIKYYQDHCLFSDEEADATVCSYKQTSFMANMIAATMVNVFVNWCANHSNGFRPVPFFTEYDAVTMQYKIKINAI